MAPNFRWPMVDFLTAGAWLGSMESAASTLGAPAELLSWKKFTLKQRAVGLVCIKTLLTVYNLQQNVKHRQTWRVGACGIENQSFHGWIVESAVRIHTPVETGALLLTVAGVVVAEEPLLERTRDGNSVSLCSGEGSSLTACADWFSKKSSSASSLLSSESRRVELASMKSWNVSRKCARKKR